MKTSHGGARPWSVVEHFGLANVLSDPILELHDSNGNPLETNDNWKDSPERAEIEGTGIPPSNDVESAILKPVNPAGYTAILRGKTGSGIAVVEIYNLR